MNAGPWSNGPVTLYTGHVQEVLRGLPAESVQCVVTSPPYWGLRNYSVEPVVWDAEPGCEHGWEEHIQPAAEGTLTPGGNAALRAGHLGIVSATLKPKLSAFCLRCGAWRGSLGLEPTPQLYVRHLVAVFREVRRVLRSDGTCFLNLGDSYAQGLGSARGLPYERHSPVKSGLWEGTPKAKRDMGNSGAVLSSPGLKPKDLVGVPWRVAFALQGWALVPGRDLAYAADILREARIKQDWLAVEAVERMLRMWQFWCEWLSPDWLRCDIIWAKPNPMPESVTDRPTRSHEYIFLLTKGDRYYWDQEAVRETWTDNRPADIQRASDGHQGYMGKHESGTQARGIKGQPVGNPSTGRNLRSVWTIATQPYSGAHFATFPEALVERCVLAGTSERGCCAECGAPWERVVGPREAEPPDSWKGSAFDDGRNLLVYPTVGKRPGRGSGNKERKIASGGENGRLNTHMGSSIPWTPGETPTLDWCPTCAHGDEPPIGDSDIAEPRSPLVPCTVLDPFSGAGTVAVVAQKLGRLAIGVDLSPQYTALAVKRLEEVPLPLSLGGRG